MKTKTTFFLTFFFLLSFVLFSAVGGGNNATQVSDDRGGDNRTESMGLRVGVSFSANSLPIKFRDTNVSGNNIPSNTLRFNYTVLEVDADFYDFLTVGAMLGFDSNKLKNALDFDRLPLTVRLEDQKFKSMVFGVRLKTQLYEKDALKFFAKGEFMYFFKDKINFAITLPIATGTASIKNSFAVGTLDIYGEYDNFYGVKVFAGPQINISRGDFKANESLENVESTTKISYRQKNFLGLMAGAHKEVGKLDLSLKFLVFSRTSICVGVAYNLK